MRDTKAEPELARGYGDTKAEPELARGYGDTKAEPELARNWRDTKAEPTRGYGDTKAEPTRGGRHRRKSRPGLLRRWRSRSAVVLTPLAGVAVAGAIIGAMALVPGKSSDRAAADQQAGSMQSGGQSTDHQNASHQNISQEAATPFAGRTVMAYLTGFEHNTLAFRTATWVAGGLDNGHYAVDGRTYHLALVDAPTIRSAVALCSDGKLTVDRSTGLPTKSCSTADLAGRFKPKAGAYAQLSVTGGGEISTISERYVP